MIIRTIIFDDEDPYSFHVQYDHCRVDDMKKVKKKIRKTWQNVYPFLKFTFTTFFEEDDCDEV